jgi:hypothetical protein
MLLFRCAIFSIPPPHDPPSNSRGGEASLYKRGLRGLRRLLYRSTAGFLVTPGCNHQVVGSYAPGRGFPEIWGVD